MPLFDYKCDDGHITTVTTRATYHPCLKCMNLATRRFSFSIASPMQPHYNPSVEQYISSNTQFKDALHRKAEEATLYTGIEHTFEQVTVNTKDAFGVTTEGLYEQAKAHHDQAIL